MVDDPARYDSHDEQIGDGFGNVWSKTCPECGQDTLEVVRPGKVQCAAETGPCSLPHCPGCGFRHENPVYSYGMSFEQREKEIEKNCPCRFFETDGQKWCATHSTTRNCMEAS